MRLGIILHDLSLGGTERIALRLANQWARAGIEVTLFCGTRAGVLGTLPDPAVRVIEAPARIRRAPGSRRRLARAAAEYFHAHPVDVCFLPGNFHWPVAPALSRLPRATRPLVVAQVSSALDKPQRGRLRQAWFELRMRRLLRAVDGVVCMSHLARDQAGRILRRDVAVRIPLPALDEDCAAPVAVSEQCRTLVAAGRLVPEKGFADLITAFSQLRDPQARLVILGSGPLEGDLWRLAWRLGLTGRVQLRGYQPSIRPWLDQARAFVLASHYEGFPAVLIEALAAGRQVITTRCTHAVAELAIGGDRGIVVPLNDTAAMVAALRHMLDTAPADPAVLHASVAGHRIGALAAEYLQAFERWSLGAGARAIRLPRPLATQPQAAPRFRRAVLDFDTQTAER